MRVKTKRNQKILEFYQKGYTQKAIARIFHISQVTVSGIIAREKDRNCEPSYQHRKNILGVKE